LSFRGDYQAVCAPAVSSAEPAFYCEPMHTTKNGAPALLKIVTLHDQDKEGIWDFLTCGHQMPCKDWRHPYPSKPQAGHRQRRRCDVCAERAQGGKQ